MGWNYGPNYSRVPALASRESLVEWVFEKLEVEAAVRAHVDGHDREADRSPPFGERAILGRRAQQRAALARTDHLEAGAEVVAGAGLDLDDDQPMAATADEVELTPPGEEAGSHHLVAAGTQEVGGGALAATAELGSAPQASRSSETRNGAQDVLWIGLGPSRRIAARCDGVAYPLWSAKPQPG